MKQEGNFETIVVFDSKRDKRNRFFLVSTTEFHGEQEYSHDFLMRCGIKGNPEKCARKVCEGWYENEFDNDPDSELNHFSFMQGQIGLTLDSVKEIPGSHFRFLIAHGYMHEL